MNKIALKLEQLTKMTNDSQNSTLRSFTRSDLEIKLKVMQLQKQLFHKLKSIHSEMDNAILTLASLILSIDVVVKNMNIVKLNAMKLRGNNNKTKIKRQKVIGYWAVVRTLKIEQNMSFRNISSYFRKYHKLEVSYSTIYTLWNELENNIGEKI